MQLRDTLVRLHASTLITQASAPGFIAPGTLTFGVNDVIQLPTADVAWSQRVIFHAAGAVATLDTNQASFSSLSPNANQYLTATPVGTITHTGTVIATITSALHSSPIVTTCNVTNGDSLATWAGKLVSAIAGDIATSGFYQTPALEGTQIQLTMLHLAPNDATFNLAIAAGTATGLTAAPASVNTPPVLGTDLLTSNGLDSFGANVPISEPLYLMLKCVGTSSTDYVTINCAHIGSDLKLYAGSSLQIVSPPYALRRDESIILTGGTAGVSLDIIAFSKTYIPDFSMMP